MSFVARDLSPLINPPIASVEALPEFTIAPQYLGLKAKRLDLTAIRCVLQLRMILKPWNWATLKQAFLVDR